MRTFSNEQWTLNIRLFSFDRNCKALIVTDPYFSGQLEMKLYSKGREPSALIEARNFGR